MAKIVSIVEKFQSDLCEDNLKLQDFSTQRAYHTHLQNAQAVLINQLELGFGVLFKQPLCSPVFTSP